MTYKVFGGR